MLGFLLALHIAISLALIVVVLLQSGKGGGLAGAFGGAGGMGAVFGGQAAATFLTKSTRYLAIGFFLSSLTMAVVVRGRMGSTVAGGLENRQPTPASSAGDIVTEEGIPEGLPGMERKLPEELPPADGETEETTGEAIPVAPDSEGE